MLGFLSVIMMALAVLSTDRGLLMIFAAVLATLCVGTLIGIKKTGYCQESHENGKKDCKAVSTSRCTEEGK